MSKYELVCGIQQKALRVGIYGVPGIGKTTLAAQFPNPVFIDVEDGSNQLPVARLPRPTSWTMLMDEVSEVAHGHVPCSTLVIDTMDAAELLCTRHVCAEHGWDGIESRDYGKGWVYLNETFAKLLDALDLVVSGGRNVVLVAHSTIIRIEQPEAEGSYDMYALKLSKKNSPMVREWCDMLLFMNYRTLVETKTNKKGEVVKAKAKGGHVRVMYTEHHACWDAKNRFGLPSEVPATYESIAHCIPDMLNGGLDANLKPAQPMQPAPAPKPKPEPTPTPEPQTPAPGENDPRDSYPDHAKALADLMRANDVTDMELRSAVASKGVCPVECPVSAYPQDFVGFLTAQFSTEILPLVVEQRKA
ncbi:MAG: ATP-binding protein [Atopobiaceae bacterium]|nr:ATP-binding protein [Atopobiaceae bacterium]